MVLGRMLHIIVRPTMRSISKYFTKLTISALNPNSPQPYFAPHNNLVIIKIKPLCYYQDNSKPSSNNKKVPQNPKNNSYLHFPKEKIRKPVLTV